MKSEISKPFQREGEWWFRYGRDYLGPYDTKADAEADRQGLKRFDRHKDEPDFITTEKPNAGTVSND